MEPITICLDAKFDLWMSNGKPPKNRDVVAFEKLFKKAAKKYGEQHNLDVNVQTVTMGSPEADYYAQLNEHWGENEIIGVWQEIHDMINNSQRT